MAILKGIKRLIYQTDMFCSSQLLRYNSETQYKTMTGGLLSLAIIIVIIVGFANMISDTLQRTSITSSLTINKQSDPPLAIIHPGLQGMYMLGFSIQSWDLSYVVDLFHGQQYFELGMILIKLENGIPSITPIALQQCTREHWQMMPEFNNNFDSFAVNKWACMPLNKPFPIQGSYTSSIAYQMLINVYKCQNSTQNNNHCAPQEDIDALFATYSNFYLTYNYVNPVINPNLKDYISYYIQGNDYVIFSKDIGAEAWVYYSEYQISTDRSIWPFEDIMVEKGCIVEHKGVNHPYSNFDQTALASVYLAKSANSLKYKREVQKISAVFSYIGGLVGAVTAVLFFVNIYTDNSLEISIGLSLFEQKQHEKGEAQDKPEPQKKMQKFNAFGFARLMLYRILRVVGWKGSWQAAEKIQKFQKEAINQLDVQLLLKRLIKLQICMTHLFSPQELKQMREINTITIENAKNMRTLFLKTERLKLEDSKSEGSGIALNRQHQMVAQEVQIPCRFEEPSLSGMIKLQKLSSYCSPSPKQSKIKVIDGSSTAKTMKVHFLQEQNIDQ